MLHIWTRPTNSITKRIMVNRSDSLPCVQPQPYCKNVTTYPANNLADYPHMQFDFTGSGRQKKKHIKQRTVLQHSTFWTSNTSTTCSYRLQEMTWFKDVPIFGTALASSQRRPYTLQCVFSNATTCRYANSHRRFGATRYSEMSVTWPCRTHVSHQHETPRCWQSVSLSVHPSLAWSSSAVPYKFWQWNTWNDITSQASHRCSKEVHLVLPHRLTLRWLTRKHHNFAI